MSWDAGGGGWPGPGWGGLGSEHPVPPQTLRHSNLVQLLGVIVEEGGLYIVTEYMAKVCACPRPPRALGPCSHSPALQLSSEAAGGLAFVLAHRLFIGGDQWNGTFLVTLESCVTHRPQVFTCEGR